jgi:GPR1/FUN34/yaaH family
MFLGAMSYKHNWGIRATFFTLIIAFILLDLAEYGVISPVAGGVVGVICALCALYTAAAVILKDSYGRVILPLTFPNKWNEAICSVVPGMSKKQVAEAANAKSVDSVLSPIAPDQSNSSSSPTRSMSMNDLEAQKNHQKHEIMVEMMHSDPHLVHGVPLNRAPGITTEG